MSKTWRKRVQGYSSDCKFAPAANPTQLASVEQSLGTPLPADLKELLLETNGVEGRYGIGLIWSAERIETDNLAFRSNTDFRELYMPFAHLLFFADNGGGDQFAFAVLAGVVRHNDVFAWNHENDSRAWVAPTLERYVEWSLSGQLTG